MVAVFVIQRGYITQMATRIGRESRIIPEENTSRG